MLHPEFQELLDGALSNLRFGQFYEIRLVWDIGGQERGQSTLYYASGSILPFWDFPSWASDIADAFVSQVWRFQLLQPTKPALGRLVHQAHKLVSVDVKAYDSQFDLLTPDYASVTVNEPGLRAGNTPEDWRHCLNVKFNLRAGAVFNAFSPTRSFVALPAPSAQDFDARGYLSSTAMNEMRPHLSALAMNIDLDGTPLGLAFLQPIRIRRKVALVDAGEVLAVGYAAVGGAEFAPQVGFRRSRVG